MDLLNSKLSVADSYSREYCEYYGLLPLDLVEGRLRLAAAGEPDQEVVADFADTYSAAVELVSTPPDQLQEAIRRTFAGADSVVELVRDLASDVGPDTLTGGSLADARDLANQPPVIRFVNPLIREAYDAGLGGHLKSGHQSTPQTRPPRAYDRDG